MVGVLASMLADAAPAIVTSLGVGAAKQFGTQAGKAAGDALFSQQQQQPQSQQQSQQQQGLFGSIGSGIGGAADAIVGLPGKVAGGILGGVGNVLSGAGNLLSGNRQQVPSSDAQQRFIAMQQQGYR
ncbi:MAG TPA: hypothetical protein V6D33_11885 [Cyanophyceae cyanobacterium]